MLDKTDLLYDHYKDSYSLITKAEKKREFLFLISLILSIFIVLQVGEPKLVLNLSEGFFKNKIGEKVTLNLNTVFSGLEFMWLWVLMMYYQQNVSIDRQYNYLHSIEERLSESVKIEREGRSYLTKYPWFLWLVFRVYTIVFPISILVVAILKWKHELAVLINTDKGYFIFDTVVLSLVVTITILYMSWIHFKDFKKQENS